MQRRGSQARFLIFASEGLSKNPGEGPLGVDGDPSAVNWEHLGDESFFGAEIDDGSALCVRAHRLIHNEGQPSGAFCGKDLQDVGRGDEDSPLGVMNHCGLHLDESNIEDELAALETAPTRGGDFLHRDRTLHFGSVTVDALDSGLSDASMARDRRNEDKEEGGNNSEHAPRESSMHAFVRIFTAPFGFDRCLCDGVSPAEAERLQ